MGVIYTVEPTVLALKFWKMHTGDYHSSLSKLLGTASFVGAFTLIKIAIELSTTITAFLVYHRFEHLFGSIGAFGTEVFLGLFLPFVLLLIPSVRGSAGAMLKTPFCAQCLHCKQDPRCSRERSCMFLPEIGLRVERESRV
jgi:hypothetical protein